MSFSLAPKVFAVCNPGDGAIDLGDCLQLSDSSKVSSVYNTPAFLVNLIVRNMFILAGIILFLMFFVAAYKFIAKGKEGIEDGRKILTTAFVGFGVMFAAYWVVQIVSLLTGVSIPGITIGGDV